MKINPKWKWNESEMKVKWNECEKKFQFLLKVKWNRNKNLKFQRNWNESEIFVGESEMKVKNFFRTFSITIVNYANHSYVVFFLFLWVNQIFLIKTSLKTFRDKTY